MVKKLLMVEGLLVMVASIYMYFSMGSSWLLFLILFLAPDVSMVGYLINTSLGAKLYNLFHTYSVPLALLVVGYMMSATILTEIGLIWAAHIGMDRMIGYGLKYETNFKETHLQRIAR